MLNIVFVGLLFIINCLYIKDIKDLEVTRIKKKSDKLINIIFAVIILGLTFTYAQIWHHYLIAFLSILAIFLDFNRRGLTHKGVIISGELNIFGYWNKLLSVEIIKNERVKVIITRKFPLMDEVHDYESEDYKKIIDLVYKHLPDEKIKVTIDN